MKLEYSLMMRLLTTPFAFDFVVFSDTPISPFDVIIAGISFFEIDFLT
jgi:hypothetical protein